MTTSVTFETATLADVLRRASSVAPKRSGDSFDKASGIMVEVRPEDDMPVLIRATDTHIFYMEWIGVVEVTGEPCDWRLPSPLIASVVGSLPMRAGSQVTFTQTSRGSILIVSGRTQCKVMLNTGGYYPDWQQFETDNLIEVSNLGSRLKQVEWAASKEKEPPILQGVHIDGQFLTCTDRYRIAKVPCEIQIEKPVTVPAGLLGSLIPDMGDTRLGTDGTTLLIMPDEHTQIRATIFGHEYPNIARALKTDQTHELKVDRDLFVEIVTRALNFAGPSDRMPGISVWIGDEEVSVRMQDAEVGLFADVVEVNGYADHPRTEFYFTPKNIMDSISNSPNSTVTIKYHLESPTKAFYIDGGSGYQSWVLPRRKVAPSDSTDESTKKSSSRGGQKGREG